MNTTVLENRIAEFTTVMKGIADNLQYFRGLVEKEMAEKEARKGKDTECEMYKKREIARCFVAHKGDGFTVADEIEVPFKDSLPPVTILKGERLTVDKVDCISSKYDVDVTVLRNDISTSDHHSYINLTLDQIRKLVENDILVVIGKANA